MTRPSDPPAHDATDAPSLHGPRSRSAMLARFATTAAWDLVVIGGGATGLGVALDAAARGFSVALVEADDFAKGTSSRATKLVHGGVRYLAQGNVALVRETAQQTATFRSIVASATDLILTVRADHRIAFASPSVERLAGEEHLPSRLTIGHPAAAPPVTEPHEPPAPDPAPENDDHRRQVRVVLLDRRPRLLACGDECAGRGLRCRDRLVRLGRVVDHGERRRVRPRLSGEARSNVTAHGAAFRLDRSACPRRSSGGPNR